MANPLYNNGNKEKALEDIEKLIYLLERKVIRDRNKNRISYTKLPEQLKKIQKINSEGTTQ